MFHSDVFYRLHFTVLLPHFTVHNVEYDSMGVVDLCWTHEKRVWTYWCDMDGEKYCDL